MSRSPLLMALAAMAVLALTASPARAGLEIESCTRDAFESYRDSGETVIAWFKASWCPTCAAQQQALDTVSDSEVQGDVRICQLDYDTHTDLRRELNIPRQSTHLRFVDGQETDRLIALTDRAALLDFINGAGE